MEFYGKTFDEHFLSESEVLLSKKNKKYIMDGYTTILQIELIYI